MRCLKPRHRAASASQRGRGVQLAPPEGAPRVKAPGPHLGSDRENQRHRQEKPHPVLQAGGPRSHVSPRACGGDGHDTTASLLLPRPGMSPESFSLCENMKAKHSCLETLYIPHLWSAMGSAARYLKPLSPNVPEVPPPRGGPSRLVARPS